MPEFASKQRIDPKSLSAQLTQKAAGDLVRRLRLATEARLGNHCCGEHRTETLQTSIMVTGFMMMAGEVLKQTGPIKAASVDQAIRAIAKELFGEGIPEADSAGEGHA